MNFFLKKDKETEKGRKRDKKDRERENTGDEEKRKT